MLQLAHEPTLSPLLRLLPLADLPPAIFSPLDRHLMTNPGSPVVFTAPEARTARHAESYMKEYYPEVKTQIRTESGPVMTPEEFRSSFPTALTQDIAMLSGGSRLRKEQFVFQIRGTADDAHVHPLARIDPLVVIDTSNGPVVIDQGVSISPFSWIRGPVYVGPDAVLDAVRLSASRIGRGCRLSGEISDSWFGDYTNKHHEGFVGHTLAGSWVNLGALTTTSDLKNNYSEIRFEMMGRKYPAGTIKFGSVIGDFVKTAIATNINTGTVIDFGCLLFEGHALHKYYPPFFWGGPESTVYELGRFLEDCDKIMARRGEKPDDYFRKTVSKLFSEFRTAG